MSGCKWNGPRPGLWIVVRIWVVISGKGRCCCNFSQSSQNLQMFKCFNFSSSLLLCMLKVSACPCFAGLLQYSHEKGERGGSLSFKFNLVDPEGNKLIDQSFFISVLGRVPSILCYLLHSNKGSSVFFHLVERRRQLLQIYPFVLHAYWCALHLGHILNMNYVEPPSVQIAVFTFLKSCKYIVLILITNPFWQIVSFHFKKSILLN